MHFRQDAVFMTIPFKNAVCIVFTNLIRPGFFIIAPEEVVEDEDLFGASNLLHELLHFLEVDISQHVRVKEVLALHHSGGLHQLEAVGVELELPLPPVQDCDLPQHGLRGVTAELLHLILVSLSREHKRPLAVLETVIFQL